MNWLRKHFDFKEIGWTEIGEQFTRYQIFKSRWLNVYLHELSAPTWHPECHDHPWSFVAVLLWRGYLERVHRRVAAWPSSYVVTEDVRRYPGQILWRPATFAHNVITPYGKSWSLIFTGPKSREWGFKPCDRPTAPTTLWYKYRRAHGKTS
jgi:hypothetical protein